MLYTQDFYELPSVLLWLPTKRKYMDILYTYKRNMIKQAFFQELKSFHHKLEHVCAIGQRPAFFLLEKAC